MAEHFGSDFCQQPRLGLDFTTLTKESLNFNSLKIQWCKVQMQCIYSITPSNKWNGHLINFLYMEPLSKCVAQRHLNNLGTGSGVVAVCARISSRMSGQIAMLPLYWCTVRHGTGGWEWDGVQRLMNRLSITPIRSCIDPVSPPGRLLFVPGVSVVCAMQHCHLWATAGLRSLTVYPASRCRLCASGRSRLDAPVIWRKLLPADSASCRLFSAMVSWIISRVVV